MGENAVYPAYCIVSGAYAYFNMGETPPFFSSASNRCVNMANIGSCISVSLLMKNRYLPSATFRPALLPPANPVFVFCTTFTSG